MTGPLSITGNIQERFVQTAVLLCLLDPVRGEPTTYGLDQDWHGTQAPRQQILKRKFVDSIALICATRRDADTVSAATLEENGPDGAVIRIASNAGVTEETLNDLRDILHILEIIAAKELDVDVGVEKVLLKIVQLDNDKIRGYLQTLKQAAKLFEKRITTLKSRLVEAFPDSTPSSISEFIVWYEHIFSIQALPPQPDARVLLEWVQWAQEAKTSHLQFVRVAFSNYDQPLPRWVGTILKIGRYSIAARALAMTAFKIPDLFGTIAVQALTAPRKEQFVLREARMPLTCTLRRVPEINAEELVPRLASLWNISDPEAHFRRSCPVDLVVHAELQIVSFYDHNPQLRPRSRYIGVSKKSCFLCHKFLNLHPAGFFVSGCHQKLYPSWTPPTAMNTLVYKQYKAITAVMSVGMVAIARQDLTCRLGSKRFPAPADSTAGISFTGLIDMGNAMDTESGKHTVTGADYEPYVSITQPRIMLRTSTNHRPFQSLKTPANVQAQSPYSQLTGPSDSGLASKRSCSCVAHPQTPLVLLFEHPYNERKQDIIAISNIIDSNTGYPSWSILVDLLQSQESLGFVFKDSDIMIVDRRLQVRNGRQFLACLQALRNDGILNAEVQICSDNACSASLV
ncbi:hypothetical protein VTL71DRAFT_14841 [Oculimacula yallundae]|uniref:Uncharacterized protein n=1 Tax=Oculimacula yallundae TaxID=86028 RepID=A0ABR4CEW8_9HELO